MSAKYHVDFLLETTIQGIYIQTPKENVEFTINDEVKISISLKPKKPEDDNTGKHGGLICRVMATYEVSEEVWLFIDSLINRNVMTRVASDIDLPHGWEFNEHTLIDVDGKVGKGFSPRRNHCPNDIAELIEKIELDFYKVAHRFLHLLRWRQKMDTNAELIEHASIFWRLSDGCYYLVPLPRNDTILPLRIQRGLKWGIERNIQIQNLWLQNGVVEPLGHAILSEAKSLIYKSPASAIIMIATALETAIKIHISNQVPNTSWLLEETSAPPIPKLLHIYIPLLHQEKGKDMSFWDDLKPTRQKIKWLVEDRNKIAHTGKMPDRDNNKLIHEYSALVSDYLYILDFLDGHEWAKLLVSNQTREYLKWQEGDAEITLTLTHGW